MGANSIENASQIIANDFLSGVLYTPTIIPTEETVNATALNLTDDLHIQGQLVLNSTTLGTTIINSSIKNLGTQNANLNMGTKDITNINELTAGTVNASVFKITDGTPEKILATGSDSRLITLPTTTYPTFTELSYLKGVSSSIQTQLNSKVSSSHYHSYSSATINRNGSTAVYMNVSLTLPVGLYFVSYNFPCSLSNTNNTLIFLSTGQIGTHTNSQIINSLRVPYTMTYFNLGSSNARYPISWNGFVNVIQENTTYYLYSITNTADTTVLYTQSIAGVPDNPDGIVALTAIKYQ